MVWIKLFVFYYLRNKQSRIWSIYESKYKRSDPWMWPLKTVWENALPGSWFFFFKPFLLFEDNANLLPSDYAIGLKECFEMKWFDLFCLMRSSSAVPMAEVNRVVFYQWGSSLGIYRFFPTHYSGFRAWSSSMLFISSPLCLLIPGILLTSPSQVHAALADEFKRMWINWESPVLAFSGFKHCMTSWSDSELWIGKELCPAISEMPCSQCVYPDLQAAEIPAASGSLQKTSLLY